MPLPCIIFPDWTSELHFEMRLRGLKSHAKESGVSQSIAPTACLFKRYSLTYGNAGVASNGCCMEANWSGIQPTLVFVNELLKTTNFMYFPWITWHTQCFFDCVMKFTVLHHSVAHLAYTFCISKVWLHHLRLHLTYLSRTLTGFEN